MNKKWTVLAWAALTVALLAGCGSKADDGGAAAIAQAAVGDQPGAAAAGDQAAAGQGGGFGGMQAMGTLGKIKSVNGNTITIYKSSFQPGQGGGRMGGNRQGAGQNAGDGAAPSGDAQPPSGDPPQQGADRQAGGQAGQGGAGGQAGQGGQRPDMANMFTEETEDITVTDATKIYKTEMADGQRTETEIAIGDLKPDDVITVTLKEGAQEAESIRLGGLGGGFGGGMRGGQGQGQVQGRVQGQGKTQADGQQAATGA
ncbi:hypothetical protein OMP38_02410 [Cohnella ginsengisoli]|uniref:DUF5666 domain-containing protein n=1 Tax=Cohnella ginsengisoli TaxID=425004 RepID=A0A9X4KCW6_9BACL|nr:hypothetical protein [Cohnella ginsengisoli]MDG0789824.1 hypothetical protein [Cohnella ginsengisoli]